MTRTLAILSALVYPATVVLLTLALGCGVRVPRETPLTSERSERIFVVHREYGEITVTLIDGVVIDVQSAE